MAQSRRWRSPLLCLLSGVKRKSSQSAVTSASDPISEVECASQRQTISTGVTLLHDLVIGREQAGRDGEHRVCSSSEMFDELPWSYLAARRSHSAIANCSHLVGCAAIAQGLPSTPSFRPLGLQ